MDELLVKMITGHFGIGPTQVGFAPKGGLGGAGVQKGEGQSNEEISLLPTIIWLTDLLNQLSYRFLGMPKDLTFQLSQGSTEDDTQQTTNAVDKYKGGVTTLNETRDGLGLPLLSFPEADMPLILNTMVPLADVEELVSGQDATGESEDVQPVSGSMKPQVEGEQGQQGDMTEPDKSVSLASIELAAFAKWTKGARKREFVFEFLDSDKGKSLNVLAKHDPAAARELANVFKSVKDADSFTPPDGVQAAAKRALAWMADGHAGDGFTDTGRKRASDLARGAAVSADTIGRMVSYFARHEVDKDAEGFNSGEDGFPSPGRVAWDAWGGDAGKTWAESVSARISGKAVDLVKAGDRRGRDSAPDLPGGEGSNGTASDLRAANPGFTWTRQ
jgi:hypothetical protein